MFKAYIKPFVSLKSNSYIDKRKFFRNTKSMYYHDKITTYKDIKKLKFRYSIYNFYPSINNSFTHFKKSYMKNKILSFASTAQYKYYYYPSIFLSIKYNINY